MSWYLAPSLRVLRAEVDRRWPKRDRTSDGTIGDAAHAARPSGHNPDPNSRPLGAVHATDIDATGGVAASIVRAVVTAARAGKLPALWYVIYNGIIYSATYGWVARAYTGTNPHRGHAHFEVRHTHVAENDPRPWGVWAAFLAEQARARARAAARSKPPVLVSLRRLKARSKTDWKVVQAALNRRYGFRLAIDGIAGAKTRAAYRRHQLVALAKLYGRRPTAAEADGDPGATSLRLLGLTVRP